MERPPSTVARDNLGSNGPAVSTFPASGNRRFTGALRVEGRRRWTSAWQGAAALRRSFRSFRRLPDEFPRRSQWELFCCGSPSATSATISTAAAPQVPPTVIHKKNSTPPQLRRGGSGCSKVAALRCQAEARRRTLRAQRDSDTALLLWAGARHVSVDGAPRRRCR